MCGAISFQNSQYNSISFVMLLMSDGYQLSCSILFKHLQMHPQLCGDSIGARKMSFHDDFQRMSKHLKCNNRVYFVVLWIYAQC